MYLARQILIAIGEDPDREGLLDTPRRFAGWWTEFVQYDPGRLETTFENMTQSGQMVAVTGLRVWSLCEHHLLPFWCDVSVAYFPTNRILGLSKFARIAHKCAHRLQVQERLAMQVANEVQALTGCADVAVFAAGEHLCMTMRGVKTPGLMSTSVARGRFEQQADWDRFFQIVKSQ